MSPADQSVLETTLGYEQVAVDLTAWLAQNEPDDYVRETFDFGLLEDLSKNKDYVDNYLEVKSREASKKATEIYDVGRKKLLNVFKYVGGYTSL